MAQRFRKSQADLSCCVGITAKLIADASGCEQHNTSNRHQHYGDKEAATPFPLAQTPSAAVDEPVYYCAYGSDMNRCQLQQRIGQYLRQEPPLLALLDGVDNGLHFMACNKYSGTPKQGVATLQPAPARHGDPSAEALCWRVEPKAIELLDDLEGHCFRETWQIKCVNGQMISAVVYVATTVKSDLGLWPSPDYLEHLLAGADSLNSHYVSWLKRHPTTASPPREKRVALSAPLDAHCIFVYGSLRPDDKSRMPWTKEFVEGTNHARASMPGGRLCCVEGYACMLRGDNDAESIVQGYLISCDTEAQFCAKLLSADEIEGYEPEGPCLYYRSVVNAVRASDGADVKTYVYHKEPNSVAIEEEIPSGDWLEFCDRRAARISME